MNHHGGLLIITAVILFPLFLQRIISRLAHPILQGMVRTFLYTLEAMSWPWDEYTSSHLVSEFLVSLKVDVVGRRI